MHLILSFKYNVFKCLRMVSTAETCSMCWWEWYMLWLAAVRESVCNTVYHNGTNSTNYYYYYYYYYLLVVIKG